MKDHTEECTDNLFKIVIASQILFKNISILKFQKKIFFHSSYWWGSRLYTSAILSMIASVFMILTKILRSQQLIVSSLKTRKILSWITNACSVVAIIFSIASVIFYTTVVRINSEQNGDEYFARDASMIYMYFDFH